MKILTSEEVATMLRISMPTLYRHIKNGIIPCIRVGRRTLFRLDDIEELLNSDTSDEDNHA